MRSALLILIIPLMMLTKESGEWLILSGDTSLDSIVNGEEDKNIKWEKLEDSRDSRSG